MAASWGRRPRSRCARPRVRLKTFASTWDAAAASCVAAAINGAASVAAPALIRFRRSDETGSSMVCLPTLRSLGATYCETEVAWRQLSGRALLHLLRSESGTTGTFRDVRHTSAIEGTSDI